MLRLISTGICLTSILAPCLAFGAPASTAVRIDSVDQKYAVQSFSFEVNPANGRVGIRIVYENPAALVGYEDTGDEGPGPRIVTLPNLRFDASTHAVIYGIGAQAVTCATEATHRTLFGKTAYMKPTGACIVSSHITVHSRDNGWDIERDRRLDTFLEAREGFEAHGK